MPPDTLTPTACRYCKTIPTMSDNANGHHYLIKCINPTCDEQPDRTLYDLYTWSDRDEARRFNIQEWNRRHGTITPEILDDLKRQWEADPIWDIENTHGFEPFREELLCFRIEKQNQWETERVARQVAHAAEMGLTVDSPLYKYIARLERTIEGLQRDVERLTAE